MRKILLSIFTAFIILVAGKANAQCDLAFSGLVITGTGSTQLSSPTRCQYTFNASFDITTNSGFKYLFFHSWLRNDYPNPAIFTCSGSTPATDPGTATQLGTTIDAAGKSILDMGFIDLNLLTFPAGTPVDVTANIATGNQYPNNSGNGVVALNTATSATVTRSTTNPDVLHFDVTGITVVISGSCGTPIIVDTDIWGSNASGSGQPGPNSKIKAQCYVCRLSQSFNDPSISLVKLCASSPFKYDIGLATGSTTDIHVVYKLYAHDPLAGDPDPSTDPLLFTSGTITLSSGNPYNPSPFDLPYPYCCVDPWAQWDIYVEVTGQEFSNTLRSQIASAACATLPVNLKLFTAVRDRSYVNLKWETATEENSKGFNVQRLIGNSGWQTIAFVESKAVNGNSTSSLTYEFTDLNINKGITQYRLRQLDIDGKQTYSIIRSVRGAGQKGKTIIFPNPTNDGKVNVIFEDKDVSRNVLLVDMNGRVINQWKNVIGNTLQIENLTTGFYTVQIINTETGEQVVEKIVVKNR